jgi:hypothetical protein
LEQNRWNHQKIWTESLICAEPGHLTLGFSRCLCRSDASLLFSHCSTR